ncbi:anti-repressor SinI family protein [Ammoniphilus sp. CFH 90114]|nr:anti-repressor SinI family protein [Ammoniphilus sp. CFH 90114]RXT15345.1 DNA-binding anti-repressor SinI [Ammoniphilus sp. CFH 90114]
MKQGLDQEWVELILMAKEMGLTIDEIRDFLRLSMPASRGRIAI